MVAMAWSAKENNKAHLEMGRLITYWSAFEVMVSDICQISGVPEASQPRGFQEKWKLLRRLKFRNLSPESQSAFDDLYRRAIDAKKLRDMICHRRVDLSP